MDCGWIARGSWEGQGQRADALDGIDVAELAGHGSGSAVYLVH